MELREEQLTPRKRTNRSKNTYWSKLLLPLLIVLLCSVISSSHSLEPNAISSTRHSNPSYRVLDTPAFLSIRAGASKTNGLLQQIVDFLTQYFPFLKKASGKRYGVGSSGDKKVNTKSHLKTKFSSGDSNNRIQKELQAFLADPPENIQLTVGKNIRHWIFTLTGVEGTVFAGEKYKLKVVFPKEYPAKPVSAYFLKPTPKHMHVYSNGDICLSLLGCDWRPTMTAQLIAISILSMLSSAKEKAMPQDNAVHAESTPGKSQDQWMYHDDKC